MTEAEGKLAWHQTLQGCSDAGGVLPVFYICYMKNDIPACALDGGLWDETGKAAKIKDLVDFPAEKYYNNKANLQPGA